MKAYWGPLRSLLANMLCTKCLGLPENIELQLMEVRFNKRRGEVNYGAMKSLSDKKRSKPEPVLYFRC